MSAQNIDDRQVLGVFLVLLNIMEGFFFFFFLNNIFYKLIEDFFKHINRLAGHSCIFPKKGHVELHSLICSNFNGQFKRKIILELNIYYLTLIAIEV